MALQNSKSIKIQQQVNLLKARQLSSHNQYVSHIKTHLKAWKAALITKEELYKRKSFWYSEDNNLAKKTRPKNLSVSGQLHPPSNISQTATLRVSCWIISLYSFTSPAILSCNKMIESLHCDEKSATCTVGVPYVQHSQCKPLKMHTNIQSLLFCLEMNL